MSRVLDDLVALLSLESIEENLFRGASQDLGFRQLFGGQVLGQSLSAASQTVEEARHVHSLHGYFLRPGDASLPVVYNVDRVRDKLLCAKPIEIRPVTAHNPYDPAPGEPVKYVWFRADGRLPDVPALHKYILAYASDFGLLTTSLLPHGVSIWDRFMQVASLDHALWFHRDLRADDWLLYAMDSPWSGNARGFARGSIFNRQGQLVASVAQEGLIRKREDWQ